MSATPDSLPKLDVRATFGALLLATFFISILYGLTTHQTYRYYRLYPQDRIWFKIFVATLWILDSAHTASCMHYSYFYLVVNYLNPLGLQNVIETFKTALLIGITVAFITNSFYAWRLHIIGEGNIILTGVTVSLTVLRFGFGIATMVEGILEKTFKGLHTTPLFAWLVWTTFSLAVATDTAMAMAITFCLHRKKTGHERTNSIVDVLMMYTINTGMITSCVTIASLIFSLAAPNTLIYLAFHSVLGKFYTNSVLAVLNSRRSLQDRGAECFVPGAFGLQEPTPEILFPTDVSRFSLQEVVERKPFKSSKSPVIDVTITRTEEVRKDEPWNIHETRTIRQFSSDIELSGYEI